MPDMFFPACVIISFFDLVCIFAEPRGQLLPINGKTEDEVCKSLERVLLTVRITNSEPRVCFSYVVHRSLFSWVIAMTF